MLLIHVLKRFLAGSKANFNKRLGSWFLGGSKLYFSRFFSGSLAVLSQLLIKCSEAGF